MYNRGEMYLRVPIEYHLRVVFKPLKLGKFYDVKFSL